MSSSEGLSELCRKHGIAPDYTDIWGNRHAAPDDTRVALLAEFGVNATTPQAVDAANRAHESNRWREILPIVIVVREGAAPWTVRLNLSAALDAAPLSWQVLDESGASHSGQFVPGELPSPERNGDFVARELPLPGVVGLGYHRLALLHANAVAAEASLVVAPPACYRPAAVQGEGRVWGAVAQVYALRSERNWGIGDFTDLRTVLEQWAHRGAAIVGVNPLHALFPHNPAHASPYSPSSRLFLNVLFVDVEAVEDFRECEAAVNEVFSAPFQARLQKLREAPLVDYPAVAETKFAALERLYAHFRDRHLAADTARAKAFRAFQAERGRQLWRHALFEALQAHFHRDDPNVWGWPAWPAPYRNPDSREVARFADAHVVRVEYYQYLQWQAEQQLAQVGRRSYELELGVGLYEDLAVSIDRGGAEAWANQDLYAATASVGAPPDDFNLAGQNWGLPPPRPERLREVRYEPLVATLRENMRHAGALRIDHVIGLSRLFWIPEGKSPADGAYVHYPFADLLGIIALESHRNQCMVIGEDLGTVPDAVREGLNACGILSYRLLFFERNAAGEFRAPADYPTDALVAASTHDLPTLAGYWEGSDLLLRDQLGLIPVDAQRQSRIVERAQDRARLLRAIEREGLLPSGATVNPVSMPVMTPEFVRSLHVYLARTPAKILVVQPEDVLGMREQVNLPATTDEHPNWRRKLALDLERFGDDERFMALANALAGLRAHERSAGPRRRTFAVAKIPRAT